MENFCKDCKYFIQHYLKNKRGPYEKLGIGHCVGGCNKKGWRSSYVRPEKKACEYLKELK